MQQLQFEQFPLYRHFFEFHEFEGVDFLLQPERAVYVLEYKLSGWGNVFFVGGILSTDLRHSMFFLDIEMGDWQGVPMSL